jgi:hypothetical protein
MESRKLNRATAQQRHAMQRNQAAATIRKLNRRIWYAIKQRDPSRQYIEFLTASRDDVKAVQL